VTATGDAQAQPQSHSAVGAPTRKDPATTDGQASAPFIAATASLYDGLVRRLGRLVLVLRDVHEAEDIAQDTYLRAFKSWATFDGRDVRAWLHTIALRLAFNELRRRRRWLAIFQRTKPHPWFDRLDPDLWQALERLDPRVRAALLMNVLDGYTQHEIASMLGVAEGTVSSWLSRARETLRTDLETPVR
jgi:RNA polymerase sigma-70 factor, ECF subfamily